MVDIPGDNVPGNWPSQNPQGGGGGDGVAGPLSSSFSPSFESQGIPDLIETGRCCEEKICSCLGGAINSIAASQQRIAQALEKKLEKPCEQIDQCFDKIVEKLREKFEKPAKSVSECQVMLANGMAGTFEYAIACAGKTVEQCKQTCSPGEGAKDGDCCKSCGKEKCICKDGQCVEVKVDKKTEGKFVGWCNRSSGSIIVTKQSEPGPGEGWEQVALAESEQAAADEAAKNCTKVTYTPKAEYPSFPQATGATGPFCSIADWINGGWYKSLETARPGANQAAAFVQYYSAIGRFGLGGLNLENVGQVLAGIYQSQAQTPGLFLSQALPTLANALGCASTGYVDALQMLGAIGIVAKETGVDLSGMDSPYRYAANLYCRSKWINPEQATAAFLSNAIDARTLDTLWGMHGACPENVSWMVQAQRPKPIQLQLSQLRRREIIGESEYRNGMRQLGWLDAAEGERLHRLTEQLPTLSDIIHLMVRDAGDESIEFWPESDRLFDQKYGAKLKQWAKWQGIPDDFAKYTWRAHWSIPSPSQLFTFLHRLRHNPKFGGEQKLTEQIKSALIQQDILPAWHAHYLACSYLPMGRIDIRRAFNVGSLSDAELIPAYEQLGYDDETCKKLAKFSIRLRDIAANSHRAIKQWLDLAIDRTAAEGIMRADGLPDKVLASALDQAEMRFENSPWAKAFVRGDLDRATFIGKLIGHGVSNAGASKVADVLGLRITDGPALRDFAAGLLTMGEARSELTTDGMASEVAERLLAEVDRAIDRAKAVACQKAAKRRYLNGDLTAGQAADVMTNTGTTANRAQYLIRAWKCEQDNRDKSITAAKLCHWLSRGAITAADFQKRLVNIGYSASDAANMLDDCLISISAQRLKQAQREAKDQALQQRRAQAAMQKAAAAVQREVTRQQRAAEQARKARLARDKQLNSAIEKTYKKAGLDLATVSGFVKSEHQRLQRDFGLSVDESLQTMILTAEGWDGETLQGWSESADTLAESIATNAVEAQAQPA